MPTQLAANLILAAWLAGDAVRATLALDGARGWTLGLELSLAAILLLNAAFVLGRRAPAATSGSPLRMLLSLAIALWPLLLTVATPRDDINGHAEALLLQTLAALVLAWGIWTLGRNFALFPERRAIVRHGPYRWLRHPIYAAYLLFDLGYCLTLASPLWLGVWVVEAWLLHRRAAWEEEVLRPDASYVAYEQRVRWRLLPGVV